ncbi:MAG: MFS transporter [Pseudomonadota bacterium]|nr:MFS transporter [Pseudomonadota bacterium]
MSVNNFARAAAAVDNSAFENSAYRKASLRIIPLIALGYGAAFIDRVNISFAALQMNRDLKFSATVYGFGAGLFFLSYAACEVPSNLLLYRFGARRWLARIMVSWGLVAMAMVFVRTPMQFYIARFFLGVAEAGFFPGAMFYISQWFPAERRARSITRFYIAWPLSVVVMGVLAGTLMGLDGRLGITGWQWLFAVEGIPSVLLGFLFLWLLPDDPATARWLTEPERNAILIHRDSLAAHPSTKNNDRIGTALSDPRVALLGIFMFCMFVCSYAYYFSAPAIVQKLSGLGITGTGFVIATMFLLGALTMLGAGILSDRARNPHGYVIAGCLMMSGGFLALSLSAVPAIALAGLFVIIIGHMTMQGALYSLATTFLKGRAAAAGIAAMNTIGCLGGFVGPYWMGIAKDLTGNYQLGLLTMVVPMSIGAGIMLYLRRRSQRMSVLAVAPATAF